MKSGPKRDLCPSEAGQVLLPTDGVEVPHCGKATRPLILQQLYCNFNQESKTGISDDNNAFKKD